MSTIFKMKMKNINFVDYISAISIVFMVGVFTTINPRFVNIANIENILTDISPLLVMATGVTLVLIIGSVDLSVGAICSCACVMTGMLIPVVGNWAILIVLLFGLFAGALNGIIFTKLRIPSFIATLCTMSFWKCAALVISGGKPRIIPINLWSYLNWSKIQFGIVSIMTIIALTVVGIYYFIQTKTSIGKTFFAVGANERAARIIGLGINKAKLCAFMLSGIASALSGVLFSIKLKSSIPTIGDQLTLLAMASVALGGTSMSGGKGSVLKTILGVLLVIIIQNGLSVAAVDAYWQQIVFGFLIIIAVFINADRSGRDVMIK